MLKHFDWDEFKCKCGCGANQFDMAFAMLLDQGRQELGFPFVVSSGYRCPAHNVKVSSSGDTGPHTTGKAVDILAHGTKVFRLLEWALQQPQITGIGLLQARAHQKRFIHLDCLPVGKTRPTVWTYP